MVWRRADGIAAARGAGYGTGPPPAAVCCLQPALVRRRWQWRTAPRCAPETAWPHAAIYKACAAAAAARVAAYAAAAVGSGFQRHCAVKTLLRRRSHWQPLLSPAQQLASARWQGSRRAGVVPSALPAALPGTETLPDGANPAQAKTPAAAAPPRQRLPPARCGF